jgi:hypothetical protein
LALSALPATLIALVTNLFTIAAAGPTLSRRSAASSLHLVVEVDPGGRIADHPIARRSRDRISTIKDEENEIELRRLTADGQDMPVSTGKVVSLGLATGQLWDDNPRQLTAALVRYNFIAKMLSGRHDVGEFSRGDAFGTRIVLEEVDRITTYGRDPVLIGDIQHRRDQRWALEARVHDILRSPLPRRHDAIFSLDVIDFIAPEREGAYLTNLWASLEPRGVLIIGTGAAGSSRPMEPADRDRQINRKTALELQALLERYFSSIFLYSMNEEVVQTGVSPNADYLLAVCADKRSQAAIFDLSEARTADLRAAR